MKTYSICIVLSFLVTGVLAQGRLIFKTGFEKKTKLVKQGKGHGLTGIDQSTGFSWDDGSLPGRINFFYLSGDHPDEFVETKLVKEKGPYGNPTHVVLMKVKSDFPDDRFGMVSRNELSYFPEEPLTEGYVKLWIKLQPNLTDLMPKTKESEQLDYYQLDSWRMLMEIKEPNSGISIKGRGTNNYRISFFMARDSVNGKMYWLLRGEMPQPVRKIDWEIENKNVEVPVGEWFTMEAYFKKDKEKGRVWWAVNGRIIADYQGRTEHPDNPMPVKFWSFAKLYQDEKWFEKGPVYQWIDDLEFWTSFPPGHGKN